MDTGGWKKVPYRLWGYATPVSGQCFGHSLHRSWSDHGCDDGWRDEVMGAVPYSTDMNLEPEICFVS